MLTSLVRNPRRSTLRWKDRHDGGSAHGDRQPRGEEAAAGGEAPGPGPPEAGPGAGQHHRPAAAGRAGPLRLGPHRPLAGAAHPVGVHRGLRHARRTPARDQRVRLGPDPGGLTRVRGGRATGAGPGRRGLRRRHGRRPGRDGGGQQGRPRGEGHLGRPRHRAAVRAGSEPVRRHRPELPLLLRPEDDVRQVRPGLRGPARWPRHPRRALRGPHAGPDPEGHALPDRPLRQRLLGRPGRLAPRHRDRPGQGGGEGPAAVPRDGRRGRGVALVSKEAGR